MRGGSYGCDDFSCFTASIRNFYPDGDPTTRRPDLGARCAR
jgi:hypothetical protein